MDACLLHASSKALTCPKTLPGHLRFPRCCRFISAVGQIRPSRARPLVGCSQGMPGTPPQPEGLGAPGVQAGPCLCPRFLQRSRSPSITSASRSAFSPHTSSAGLAKPPPSSPQDGPRDSQPSLPHSQVSPKSRGKGFPQASEPDFTPRVLKQPALQPAESLLWFKKSKIQIKAAGQSPTLTHTPPNP